jgi:hypothetical protein
MHHNAGAYYSNQSRSAFITYTSDLSRIWATVEPSITVRVAVISCRSMMRRCGALWRGGCVTIQFFRVVYGYYIWNKRNHWMKVPVLVHSLVMSERSRTLWNGSKTTRGHLYISIKSKSICGMPNCARYPASLISWIIYRLRRNVMKCFTPFSVNWISLDEYRGRYATVIQPGIVLKTSNRTYPE